MSAIVFAMLLPMLTLAMQLACPLYVGVSQDGNIFFDRFQGWLRIDANTLESIFRQGCRTNATSEPKPVTSVGFAVSPKAPQEKIDIVFSILEKNGWTRERVTVGSWNSFTRQLARRFYMDKTVFSTGERVLLHFEVTNSGSEPYWLDTTGLPGMPLCAGYSVKVLSDDITAVTHDRGPVANTCVLNGQPKHFVIDPGTKYTQDIDLSLYLDVSVKGDYVIEAQHHRLRRNGDPVDPLDCKATFKFQLQ